MKGLSNLYLPVRDPVPSRDLNLVLAMLVKSPFKPLAGCSFCHLSVKMAFIIARSISELNTLMTDPPFTSFHMDNVVFRRDPTFIPKVVSDFHINQIINLLVFFLKLPSNVGVGNQFYILWMLEGLLPITYLELRIFLYCLGCLCLMPRTR